MAYIKQHDGTALGKVFYECDHPACDEITGIGGEDDGWGDDIPKEKKWRHTGVATPYKTGVTYYFCPEHVQYMKENWRKYRDK